MGARADRAAALSVWGSPGAAGSVRKRRCSSETLRAYECLHPGFPSQARANQRIIVLTLQLRIGLGALCKRGPLQAVCCTLHDPLRREDVVVVELMSFRCSELNN